jgi:hypothetical protein
LGFKNLILLALMPGIASTVNSGFDAYVFDSAVEVVYPFEFTILAEL